MEILAIACSLVAVVLCIVILVKVNKLLTMLRTPIFKKLTPDMNLKPNSRRPISAQEMAQRGERNNKENRQNKERPNKDNRENRGQQNQAQQQQGRDRNEQRQDRGPRRDRREGRPERPRREANAENQVAAEQTAPVATEAHAPAAEAPVEARRPLAPRIPVETPAAPAVEVAPAAPVAEAPVEAAETTFDPSKVRYGRRNVIKKAPELSDEEA